MHLLGRMNNNDEDCIGDVNFAMLLNQVGMRRLSHGSELNVGTAPSYRTFDLQHLIEAPKQSP